MHFEKIYLTEPPKTYLAGFVGRRPYSAKNLLKPAVAKPPLSPSVPFAGPSTSLTREWLTKEEILPRLRMGETFFDKLKKQGKIPYRKYSRKKVLFDPVAVEAALSAFDVEVRS